MNKRALFCFLILLFSASQLKTLLPLPPTFIVWNVGQGLWTTWVDPQTCNHFDMGGEFSPLARVSRLCRDKLNRIYLSHWDLDHISFVGKARAVWPRVCLALGPEGPSTARKEKLIEGLPSCAPFPPARLMNPSPSVSTGRSSNELSHVMLMRGALIPGDSVSSQEKFWSQGAELHEVRWLVLGHHGSRTSTSEELLRHLPHLRAAIASARKKRYGHPHAEVVARLREHHVPLLRTEEWGDLWFQ